MNYLNELITLCDEIGCNNKRNEPMSAHTTFQVGGVVPLFMEPSTLDQISRITAFCSQRKIPLRTIGNGSNLLVADEGADIALLCLGSNFAGIHQEGETNLICEAGASLSSVCAFALKHSLSGLEFAWGIPGNVGGAVYMNAGAYGGEMKDVLARVIHVSFDGGICCLEKDALKLSYRHSIYKENSASIALAEFSLRKGNQDEIRAKMDDYITRRKTKQPLEFPSAGSTFKRPVGGYASALIDQCGLKGLRVGGAMVSEKHAGFIINYENATCKDILDLVAQVQSRVKKQTGFELELEVERL